MVKRAVGTALLVVALMTSATASATPTQDQCNDPVFTKTNPTLCGQPQPGGTPFGIGGAYGTGGSNGSTGGLGGLLHSLTGGLL
jgi:ABC-type nitrate/sulfonate/bicarbonate transport system substrate-binding protein